MAAVTWSVGVRLYVVSGPTHISVESGKDPCLGLGAHSAVSLNLPTDDCSWLVCLECSLSHMTSSLLPTISTYTVRVHVHVMVLSMLYIVHVHVLFYKPSHTDVLVCCDEKVVNMYVCLPVMDTRMH